VKRESLFLSQLVPVGLALVIFFVLSGVLYFEIVFLNRVTFQDIALGLRWSDILVGMTIYLKTSVDFAIFMGNLMDQYPGWRNRVAIESGTAFGNALGSIAILALWILFRNIDWILTITIVIASFVLLKLAEEGLDHAKETDKTFPYWFVNLVTLSDKTLRSINGVSNRFLRYVIPDLSMRLKKNLAFWGLIGSSFLIPFILGLDNFAGYIPVFSLVNVFGFLVGVFAAHMLLNVALFISPRKTTRVVKNPIISLVGSLVFVGLAIYGFIEAFRILFLH